MAKFLSKLIGNINTHTSIQSEHFNDIYYVKNNVLIWLDSTIDERNTNNCQDIIKQLENIFNVVNTFTDCEQCLNFLNGIINKKVFMIISGSFGQTIVPKIHNLEQIDSIFIFCMDKLKHKKWTNEWCKIIDVYTNISSICQILQGIIRENRRNSISISVISTNDNIPNQSSEEISMSFMYTKILKDILLEIEYKETDFKEFIDYCQQLYKNDITSLETIHELKRTYNKRNAIWWYTRKCFLYEILNRALRYMDIDIIIKMGFFIKDLHQQIKYHYSKQSKSHNFKESFIVYRGQLLSEYHFEQMQKIQDKFISFNNFLSTSIDRDISLKFAKKSCSKNKNMISVLFIMTINPLISTIPFVSIEDVSYYRKEHEILFSMHTFFYIKNIKLIDEIDSIWEIELTQISDHEHELCALTKCLQDETKEWSKWDGLGRFFIRFGRLDKAQEVYEAALKKTINDNEIAHIYNQLGLIKDNRNEYKQSISFYKKSLEIIEKMPCKDRSNLATIYSNIAAVYTRIDDHLNGILFHEKALDIRKEIFKESHSELANSYNNLGLLYMKIDDLSKARLYLEKARDIREDRGPKNHPDIADSYNNLGLLYKQLNDDSQARTYFQSALEIRQKILPSTHPLLVKSRNLIN